MMKNMSGNRRRSWLACVALATTAGSAFGVPSYTQDFSGFYAGSVVTTSTPLASGALSLDIAVDAETNAISGRAVTNPIRGGTGTMCGAGWLTGLRTGNILSFSYRSDDANPLCGSYVGRVFSYTANIMDTVPPSLSGTYATSGQSGQFSLTCSSINCLATVADMSEGYDFGDLREYSYQDGSYFYSALPAEQQTIESGQLGSGWVVTGNRFKVMISSKLAGSFPVCRFRGDSITVPGWGHFYTALPSECEALSNGSVPFWIKEGFGFYAYLPATTGCPQGTTALYRQYNPSLHNHHFQTSNLLNAQQQAAGWTMEGIPFCVTSAYTVAIPTNGSCGVTNGTTVSTKPTANLCAAGYPSTVTGSGPWTWSCLGGNGGGNASCFAGYQPPNSSVARASGTWSTSLSVPACNDGENGTLSITYSNGTIFSTYSTGRSLLQGCVIGAGRTCNRSFPGVSSDYLVASQWQDGLEDMLASCSSPPGDINTATIVSPDVITGSGVTGDGASFTYQLRRSASAPAI